MMAAPELQPSDKPLLTYGIARRKHYSINYFAVMPQMQRTKQKHMNTDPDDEEEEETSIDDDGSGEPWSWDEQLEDEEKN